jgi:Histidine kinase-, DNA gyrase B-, and HSP90-like ATPase
MVNHISVDTRPTKEVLVSSLTRDASLEACLFDLIDNSIDAARIDSAAKTGGKSESHGLPNSYAGYKVSLSIEGDEIKVVDNCGGMSINDLSTNNFRFGKRSNHTFGIGLYGVGMNRALFKLGETISVRTENTNEAALLSFSRKAYLADEDNWNLDAAVTARTGVVGTVVCIRDLDGPIARQTSDDEWKRDLVKEISERYSIFLEKGLGISVGNQNVSPTLVEIRTDGPFPPLAKSFKINDKTRVFIQAGQHARHRFSAEPDSDTTTNREISEEYGWSIVCNDRVIVMLDASPKTGWDKKWHNEFNGFVGYVKFVSHDPAELPWNTAKTDVDANNPAYQAVLSDMRSFTEAWRANATFAKKAKKTGNVLNSPSKSPLPVIPPATPATPAKVPPVTTKSKPVTKPSPTSLPTVLPADIDETHCVDKLLQLVHEAKTLSIYSHHYSALALMRMLFEASARIFLIRHKLYENAKSVIIPLRETEMGKLLDQKQRSNFVPTMDEMATYMANNPSIWRAGSGPHMTQSLTSFSKKKSRMNSAIHQPVQMINITEAVQIRDDILPLFRQMIEE